MNNKDKKEYEEYAISSISESVDKSIDSIVDFKFPYLTHTYSDEQLFRLEFFTKHLRDKCNYYLSMLDHNSGNT